MLNYKSYSLLLESKAKDKKKDKIKDKIKKFANFPEIYNWVIEKCTNTNNDGLKYAIWVANILKIHIIKTIKKDNSKLKTEKIEELLKNGNRLELENILKDKWINKKDRDKNTKLEGLIETCVKDINEKINYVLDWLINPLRDEKVNLSELTFNNAYKKSENWYNSLKASGKITDESGKVLIEFPDGFYWIDLETTYSKDEADAMGHCGNTNEGSTLYSLRDKNKSPHITVAYDINDGIIYQMKGRNNKKPIDKYHQYIYRLLIDPIIKPKYFVYEYNKEEDFNLSDFDKETFNKIFKYNPKLIYDSINYDMNMCKGLIEKEYLNKDGVKDILMNIKTDELFFVILDEEIFTDEEMKKIYKSLDINLSDFGELGHLLLFNHDIISIKQLSKLYPEILINPPLRKTNHSYSNTVNNKVYISANEDDIEPFMSDSVKKILFNDFLDWWNSGDWWDMESSDQVWDYLTKETKEEVIKKIIGKEITVNDNKIIVTDNMIKWKNDEYYLFYNDDFKITEIIDDKESLEDLYTELNRSLLSAQKSADQEEYYKQAQKALEGVLGNFTRDSIVKVNYHGNKYDEEVFLFDFYELIDISEMIYYLREDYYGDYETNDYGNLLAILAEMNDNKAEIYDNYGYYGNIDKDYMNDCVLNDISALS